MVSLLDAGILPDRNVQHDVSSPSAKSPGMQILVGISQHEMRANLEIWSGFLYALRVFSTVLLQGSDIVGRNTSWSTFEANQSDEAVVISFKR